MKEQKEKPKNIVTVHTCDLTGRKTVKWTDKDGIIKQALLKVK